MGILYNVISQYIQYADILTSQKQNSNSYMNLLSGMDNSAIRPHALTSLLEKYENLLQRSDIQ